MTIEGTAAPDAEIRLDTSGDDVDSWRANDLGRWQYEAELERGRNDFAFLLDEDQDVRAAVTIYFEPQLQLVAPEDGATVNLPTASIAGVAPPGSEVRLNIKDERDEFWDADSTGKWLHTVDLELGANEFDFFLQDFKDVRLNVTVVYEPPERLKVTSPADGTTVDNSQMTITGTAPVNAEVRLNIADAPDDYWNADGNGQWSYEAELKPGDNHLDFFLQENPDIRAQVTVRFEPPPTPTAPPTATPAPTATPTATPIVPTPTDVPPTSTPAPTAEPTATKTEDEIKAEYRRDLDVREVVKDVDRFFNWKLYYEGEVLTIQVTDEGTLIQLMVQYPGAGQFDWEGILVLYDDPNISAGIFEGDVVGVWARPITDFTFTNAFGGEVTQPLFDGDYLQKLN